jgi:hypothetical protein
MQRVISVFLIWRLLLFLPVIVAPFIIVQRLGYVFATPWANFDGIHYLSIAQNGYINQAAFFPLFPLLINLLSFGKLYFLSGMFISNMAFLFALLYLYKLMILDYSKKRSWEMIIYTLLFPTAFFFGAVYSESLFLLLLVLAFYFARKGKWMLSSMSALLLGATRLVGILILPALIYELYFQNKKLKDYLTLLIIPLGLSIYSVFNYLKWGDPLYFINAHSELGNSRVTDTIILFPQTVVRYFKILSSLPIQQYEWWVALLEIVMFIVVSILLYIAWKKKVRVSYLIFSVLAFLLPASSGTFSGLPRYVLVLFPIYIVLSYMSGKIRRIYLVISTIILIVLLMFFSRGYFVA